MKKQEAKRDAQLLAVAVVPHTLELRILCFFLYCDGKELEASQHTAEHHSAQRNYSMTAEPEQHFTSIISSYSKPLTLQIVAAACRAA